jgi:hypothetical protein
MTDLKKTMFAILSGEISIGSAIEDMTNDECLDLFKSLELLRKAKFISPAEQKKSRLKAQKNANIDAKEEMNLDDAEVAEKPVSKPSHLSVIKAEELVKFDSNGQWSLAKAGSGGFGGIRDKPKKPAAPTLDYGKMNAKPDYKDIEAKAPTLDYGKMNAKPDYKDIEAKAPTLDYSKMNAKPDYKDIEAKADTIDYSDKRNVQVKKPWAGAAAQRDKARAKIDAASKQSAVEHLAEKRTTRKRFGV